MPVSDQQIGHNRNLNKFRAIGVAFFGLCPLVPAIHMVTFLERREFWLVYMLGGVALALFALAWWIWRRPPAARAILAFNDDGFFLDVATMFNHFEHDVLWSDLREIRFVKGGYGVRILEFLLTHEASVRLGLVQPTTRDNAPDLLVGRKVSVPLAVLELGGSDVIGAMTEAADKAGFEIARKGWREYLIMSYEIFGVTQKA